jgi:hypothetical protein
MFFKIISGISFVFKFQNATCLEAVTLREPGMLKKADPLNFQSTVPHHGPESNIPGVVRDTVKHDERYILFKYIYPPSGP